MNERLSESTLSEFTLRELYNILFRNKKKILIFFFSTVIISWAYVVTIPDVYLSEALLLVTAGRENVQMIPTTDKAVSVNRSNNLNTDIEILRSRKVIEELVDQIGVQAFLKTNLLNDNISDDQIKQIHENITLSLLNNISYNTQRNTNVIRIAYEAKSPELAQKVVSTLIDVFLKNRIDVYYSDSEYNFFNNQVNETKIAIKNIEERLVELNNKLLVGSSGDYNFNLLNRIELLQQEIDQNQTAIIESESKIEYITNELRDKSTSIKTKPDINNENIQNEIFSLFLRKQELLSKYTEENIQVKEIDLKIAELRKLLIEETTDVDEVGFSYYQQLNEDLITEKVNIISLRTKNDVLKRRLADLKKNVNRYNALQLEITRLEREKNNLIDNYNIYNDNLEEAKVDQVVQKQKLSNIKNLQHATYPKSPVATRKHRNLALGFFMGFFGSIGFAFVSEYFDHSIRSKEDIEKRLQLRMLVSIPLSPK